MKLSTHNFKCINDTLGYAQGVTAQMAGIELCIEQYDHALENSNTYTENS